MAYDYLREQILTRQIRPGTRLVNRVLAREIGISFTPVREAINRLASEGIVRQVAGAGAYVEHILREDIADLFVLRRAIESLVIEQATSRINPLRLSTIEHNCDEMEATLKEAVARGDDCLDESLIQRWKVLEQRFDESLVEATENRWLRRRVGEMRTLCQTFAWIPPADSVKALTRDLVSYRQLLNFLAKRQAMEAVEWSNRRVGQLLAAALEYFDSSARRTSR